MTALVYTAAVVATSLLEWTDLIRSARTASSLMGEGIEHSGHTVGQVVAEGTGTGNLKHSGSLIEWDCIVDSTAAVGGRAGVPTHYRGFP